MQSSGIVSNIETVSGSTGDINNPAVTQTGLPASETGANAASTRSGILGGVKTDVGDNQTTNTTEPVALTPTDTATILTKESAVPKNSDSVSGSTEIDNTVTKATAAGSEKTGTGTRTFVQDDNQKLHLLLTPMVLSLSGQLLLLDPLQTVLGPALVVLMVREPLQARAQEL